MAPLAREGTVTVGVIILTDTGSELPVESLESVRDTKDCLSVDVDVVLRVCRGRQFICELVGHRLCSGSRQ